MKIDIAHLYILNRCEHSCPLCCNRLYDINKLPNITNEILSQVHTLCLTGGDPFYYSRIRSLVSKIRFQFRNIDNIYAYTSGPAFLEHLRLLFGKEPFCDYIPVLDGVTISPKNENDWKAVSTIIDVYDYALKQMGSNRLIVFKDQIENFHAYTPFADLERHGLKTVGRVWQEEFNTPDNEGFYRLPILLDYSNANVFA